MGGARLAFDVVLAASGTVNRESSAEEEADEVDEADFPQLRAAPVTMVEARQRRTAPGMGFVMKIPSMEDAQLDKVLAWGVKYSSFRVVDARDADGDILDHWEAGGLFKTLPPPDLPQFKRSVSLNLTNWKVKQGAFKQGWLVIVPAIVVRDRLRLTQEAETACADTMKFIMDVAVPKEIARREQARAAKKLKACAILGGLFAMDPSLQTVFDALAATTRERQKEVAAQRKAKRRKFNDGRWAKGAGEADQVRYTDQEIYACEDWPAVKRMRLSLPPRDLWRDQDSLVLLPQTLKCHFSHTQTVFQVLIILAIGTPDHFRY
jgi:hypothetical protein